MKEYCVLFCLSGGIDSTTMLAQFMYHADQDEDDYIVHCVTFKYPSKHNEWERTAAHDVAKYYNIPLYTIDVTALFSGGSSALLNNEKEIPEGHYEEESMKQTVVPLRNIIFAAVAAAKGIEIYENNPFTLALGVHAGDHAIYPDCRENTLISLSNAIREGSDGIVYTIAPFINMSKAEIVKIGIDCAAPYHLTRTCYKNQELACGKCGSCTERLEAFAANNIEDPIEYAL